MSIYNNSDRNDLLEGPQSQYIGKKTINIHNKYATATTNRSFQILRQNLQIYQY